MRRPSLEKRTAEARALDNRLLALGFRVGYRHADHCAIAVGVCTCRNPPAVRKPPRPRRSGLVTR
jgi:hypothetical protein